MRTHTHTHTEWSATKGSGSLRLCSWLKGSLPPQRGGRCYSRRAKTTKLLAVWHLPWETQGERRDGRNGNLWASECGDVILPNGVNKRSKYVSLFLIHAYISIDCGINGLADWRRRCVGDVGVLLFIRLSRGSIFFLSKHEWPQWGSNSSPWKWHC